MAELVTRVQIKARLDISDVADDALIDELNATVSDWIIDYTRRALIAEPDATYVVDTSAGSVIEFPRGLRAVTSLGIAQTDQPDAGGTYIAVAAADILLRPSPSERRPGWPAERILIRGAVGQLRAVLNGARIVGDVGFAAVPARVQEVALDAITQAFTMRGKPAGGAIGPEGTRTVDVATLFGPGSPQLETLQRFRVPGMA